MGLHALAKTIGAPLAYRPSLAIQDSPEIPMLRNTGAVVAGLIIGMIFNMAIVTLSSEVLFPMPEGTSFEDTEKFNAYLATLPTSAFLLAMLAHLGQSFIGGWIAARLATSMVMTMAMMVGILSMFAGIANMMMIELPSWMLIEMPLYLAVAWLAGRMELSRRASALHS